ncbi:MAG TPA: acetate kinase [Desulfovibrio sp.]|nr:acetate kinase [Desulfovibrio sp.]
MKIFVVNCGSSSFKFQLINMESSAILCSGLVERISAATGNLTYKQHPGTKNSRELEEERAFANHSEGIIRVMELLTDETYGVMKNLDEISACGHRGVMGAEKFTKPTIVEAGMLKTLKSLSILAPLHNPPTIQGMEIMNEMLPCPSVAVFDTEFHSTMPEHTYKYAIPEKMYDEFGIRRYGFHGTSHRYVSEQAADFMGKDRDKVNLITCHLGNGSSVTAVQDGRCVDTSMGLTPLSGVVMGTRSGDIDPAIYPFLARQTKNNIEEIDAMLNAESGLKGICSMNDMRDIHSARAHGDPKAELAFQMFCYSIRKYIGAYFAVLDRVDSIVFTGGIGENDDIARSSICAGLSGLGIEIDAQKNSIRSPESRSIATEQATVDTMIIPTNEELAIATATMNTLKVA